MRELYKSIRITITTMEYFENDIQLKLYGYYSSISSITTFSELNSHFSRSSVRHLSISKRKLIEIEYEKCYDEWQPILTQTKTSLSFDNTFIEKVCTPCHLI